MQEMLFYLLFHSTKELSAKRISVFLRNYFKAEAIQDLQHILENDPKYQQTVDNKWKIRELSYFIENKPIEDVCFVITDLETTGPIMGNDKIIDIAAQKLQNNQVVDSFTALVNPERHIPTNIQRLTKIKDQDVAQAKTISAVIHDFQIFAKDCIFVAHNSKFDFLFLNYILREENLSALDPYLEICTFRLARKLLPNVRSCGLKGLAEYFDYSLKGRHRAMPDVEATIFYLQKFLQWSKEKGIHNVHDLISFQRDTGIYRTLRKKEKRSL